MWSDEKVRELARRCVAAADEVWRLQNDADRESRYFQRMIGQKKRGGSRQGVYLASPEGKLLARINSRNPRKVERVLREGLARWEAMKGEARDPADPAEFPERERWEGGYPDGGLVLRVFKRDLVDGDGDVGGTTVGRVWNLDYAWFDAAEVSALLPAQVEPGMRVLVPRTIAVRLARFHIVDNVRGQTLPFAESEVEELSLWLEVTAVEPGRVRARLEGRVACRASEWVMGKNDWTPRRSWPRGLDAEIRGNVVVDTATRSVLEFDAVAVATGWGRTRFNARRKPEKNRFAAAFTLAPKDAPRVAPAFVDVYDAGWLRGRRVVPPRP